MEWLRHSSVFCARLILTEISSGSEGTLAAIFSAELKISPLPREKGIGADFLCLGRRSNAGDGRTARFEARCDRTYRSSASRSNERQLEFKAARDFLELDAKPCESILIVEFYDDMSPIDSAILRRERSDCAP